MKHLMNKSYLSLVAFTLILSAFSISSAEAKKKKHHKPYNKKNYYGYYNNNHYGYYNNNNYGYNHGYYDHADTSATVYTSCAPEIVQDNLAKTDKLAKDILENSKYSRENSLLNSLQNILEIKDNEHRLMSYFSLVDVTTKEEILYFIGAREEDLPKYEKVLVKNTGISKELATELVDSFLNALKI